MGTSIASLYATVSVRNDVEKGAAQVTASIKKMQREIEASAGESMDSIRGGILGGDKQDRSASEQERQVLKGLGLEKQLTAAQREAQREQRASEMDSGRSLARHDKNINSLNASTRAKTSIPQNAGVAEEQSLAKQVQGLEKFAKVTMAASAGVAVLRGGTAAWKRDWDGVQEAVNQLPFGIGHLSSAVADLKAEWTGAKKEIEAYQEQAARIDRDTAAAKKATDVLKSAREGSREGVAAADREMGGLGKQGLERELYDIAAGSDARVQALEKAKKDAIKSSGADKTSKQAMQIGAEFDNRIAAEKLVASAKSRQAQIDADNAEIMQARQTGVELRAIKLEMEGRGTEAQIQRIVEGGKLQAQAERDAGRFRAAAAIEANAKAQADLVQLQHQKEIASEAMSTRASIKGTRASLSGDEMGARRAAIDEETRRKLESLGGEAAGPRGNLARGMGELAKETALRDYNQSVVSGQSLGMTSAFASPNIAVSGKQQREDAAKELTQTQVDLLNKIEAVLTRIEENTKDSGVTVGRN